MKALKLPSMKNLCRAILCWLFSQAICASVWGSAVTTTTLRISGGEVIGEPVVFTVTVQAPAAAGAPVGVIELTSGGQATGLTNTLSPTSSGNPNYAESTTSWTFGAANALYNGNYAIGANFIGSTNFLNSSNSEAFTIAPVTNYTSLPDGVQIASVVAGSGPEIQAGQMAYAFYTGYYYGLFDGEEFDDSAAHPPGYFDFTVDANPEQVIPGFDQGMLGMKVGETRVVIIPSAEGYQDGLTRLFVLELLSINEPPVATPPTLTIAAPTPNERYGTAAIHATGTAMDLTAVAGVYYRLNTNGWNLASTTNGFANWSATLPLTAGTNTLNAYAVDPNESFSTTSSVSFFSTNAFMMQLGAAQPLATGGLGLTLNVSTGLLCQIDVSTDLVNWSDLTNFTSTNATMQFRDAAATNNPMRFYRAVVP
jgi:hypothetical protein